MSLIMTSLQGIDVQDELRRKKSPHGGPRKTFNQVSQIKELSFDNHKHNAILACMPLSSSRMKKRFSRIRLLYSLRQHHKCHRP
jgi:hypothetical protein